MFEPVPVVGATVLFLDSAGVTRPATVLVVTVEGDPPEQEGGSATTTLSLSVTTPDGDQVFTGRSYDAGGTLSEHWREQVAADTTLDDLEVDGTLTVSGDTEVDDITVTGTLSGVGATMIALTDSADLYTGTNVETAMAEKLTGLRVADVANNALVGGVCIEHPFVLADAATGDTDFVLTHKTEITSIEVWKTSTAGGSGDAITVKNVATAITDALDLNVADKVIVRPTTMDDAATVVDAGTILRFSRVKATNNACRVVVRGIRRAPA